RVLPRSARDGSAKSASADGRPSGRHMGTLRPPLRPVGCRCATDPRMVRLTIRLVLMAVVAVGVTVSGFLQDPPPMPTTQKAGYFVLAGDCHVHSFPGDGGLPPWEIAREAARRRLDVVALTNHNSMLSSRLAHLLGLPGRGALLIPSQELTAVGYHLAAVGIDGLVDWRPSVPPAGAALPPPRGRA